MGATSSLPGAACFLPGAASARPARWSRSDAMKTAEQMKPEAGLAVRLPDGRLAPLVVGPRDWKELIGDSRDEHSIRTDCENGVLPCLPRAGVSGAHWRIATARALEQLGVPFEIVTASS